VTEVYEPIVWNESLMTGVGVIDEQHQILVNMINDAHDKLGKNNGRSALEEIVRDLMSYALYHFDTEEELMHGYQYPEGERELHALEHRAFSTKVANLQLDLKQGKLIARNDLLAFLNGWLVNHILKVDMKLGNFLNDAAPKIS
jgi:hemerythrin-like metal-binding protein